MGVKGVFKGGKVKRGSKVYYLRRGGIYINGGRRVARALPQGEKRGGYNVLADNLGKTLLTGRCVLKEKQEI